MDSCSDEDQTNEEKNGNSRSDDEHDIDKESDILDSTTSTALVQNKTQTKKYNKRRGRSAIVPKKAMGPACNCKLKCYENVSEETRIYIFNSYYGQDMTWLKQKQFIVSRVTEKPVLRRYTNGNHHSREFTLNYTFLVKENPVKVCKTFFLSTLAISSNAVKNAVTKVRHGMSLDDRRGKTPSGNKIPEKTKDYVRKHLDKISKLNLKEKSNSDSNLKITKLYSLYLKFCDKERIPKKNVAKYWLYRSIFRKEYDSLLKSPAYD